MTIYEQRQRAGYRQWQTTLGEPGTNLLKQETRIVPQQPDGDRSRKSRLRNEAESLAQRLPSIRLENDIFQLV
jgi:hypothetical protein